MTKRIVAEPPVDPVDENLTKEEPLVLKPKPKSRAKKEVLLPNVVKAELPKTDHVKILVQQTEQKIKPNFMRFVSQQHKESNSQMPFKDFMTAHKDELRDEFSQYKARFS